MNIFSRIIALLLSIPTSLSLLREITKLAFGEPSHPEHIHNLHTAHTATLLHVNIIQELLNPIGPAKLWIPALLI